MVDKAVDSVNRGAHLVYNLFIDGLKNYCPKCFTTLLFELTLAVP